ncbi:hypothetical protein RGQ29_016194 [Quercus rubra]|uniref:PLATZ transcription factor family protein n=1 Tax=Quercus rubra TaxID=3512 RepID=A0AAN7FEH5_QUERU|nr:hypothetical protein RGQ29_016194 [Quercus rubra]
MDSKFPPPWLTSFLNSEFYEPCSCDKHGLKDTFCNFFCRDCEKNKIFCERCKNKHDAKGHKHKVLQVRKASHHNAIRSSNISGLLDISDIHHYTVNHEKIVFLQTRNKTNEYRANAPYKCQVCGYELLDISNFYTDKQRASFKFCSIACKVKDTVISRVDPYYEVPCLTSNWSDEFPVIPRVDPSCEVPCLTSNRSNEFHQSNRKRRRKGTPIRSHFF